MWLFKKLMAQLGINSAEAVSGGAHCGEVSSIFWAWLRANKGTWLPGLAEAGGSDRASRQGGPLHGGGRESVSVMMAKDFFIIRDQTSRVLAVCDFFLQGITALHSISVTSHLVLTAVLCGRPSRCMPPLFQRVD